MKIKHPLQARWARRFAAGLVLVFLAVAVFWLRNAIGQQPSLPKLTLIQIEQLVSHSVPDSVLAAQIERRGLAFAPSPTMVESLRAKGAGPLTLEAIEARFLKPALSAAIPAELSAASDSTATGNLSQERYVDRDCDGAEDGQPRSILEDLSQQDVDQFSIELHPGCFSGYILIPQSWEYYHMQAAGPLDNWWLAYKWYVSKNSSSGQRPPLQAGDLVSMTHGSHKIRVQGHGQLLFLRTPSRSGTAPVSAPVQQTNGVYSEGGGMGFGQGNGSSGNTGGLYQVGGRVSAPVVIHSEEAQFSDVARKAKYQGVCMVSLIVDTQGNPQNVHVTRSLGMGLDEKAIEAVQQYKFRPALLDGRTPVPVAITVKIEFQLY
jgi:TonB family protein